MKRFFKPGHGMIALSFVLQTGCIIATKPNPSEKTFFSSWSTTDGITLNLTGANQGGTNFSGVFTFGDASSCTCTFNVRLTDGRFNNSSGSFNTLSCSSIVGNQASLRCPSLTYSGNYVQTAGNLVICQSASTFCQTYQ